MAWEILAGAGISAIGGALASNSAADAQARAAREGIKEQQRGLGIQLGLQEPGRFLGYNAMNDINAEFGYNSAPWASASQLNESTMDASAIIKALQSGMSFEDVAAMGRLGALNPKEISKLTGYGLTSQQIQQLSALPGSVQGGQGGYGQPSTGRGFMASPDYQFRRDEGMRGIERSAAARGGAFSGNALRGLADFNSGLAGGEYNNWFNKRATLAGFGQAASNQAGNAVQQTSNNIGQLQQNQGDARASGIMGGANSIANSVNSGLQNYLMYQGGYYGRPKTGGDQFSPWGG